MRWLPCRHAGTRSDQPGHPRRADVAASTAFYQRLGFPLSSASVPGEVSFFRTGGGLLGIWGARDLAADARRAAGCPGLPRGQPGDQRRVAGRGRRRARHRPGRRCRTAQTRRGHRLGRLPGLFRRPRRPCVGGRAQPVLAAGRAACRSCPSDDRAVPGKAGRKAPMARLLVGPVLRHVGTTDATVFVETDEPCEVEILGARERTWLAGGHHYALVTVDGLPPATATPYEVHLDGERVWPPLDTDARRRASARRAATARSGWRSAPAGTAAPRTPSPTRTSTPTPSPPTPASSPGRTSRRWPDGILMLGDQVYADETTEATRRRIRAKREITDDGPGLEVADFEEYTWLYLESWTDPDVRWLMSTVGSSMIFDDHDIRDDWNTSHDVAPGHGAHQLVAGPHRRRAVDVLDLPAPGQPLPRRAARERAVPEGAQPRRRRRPAAARVRDARRRRGRRREGHPLVLPPRLRTGPAADDRLPVRTHPRRPRAQHGQQGRVRLDHRRRPRAATTTCSSAPHCPGCSGARCTTSRRGTKRCATDGAASGWPGSASGCAAPPTSSTGRPSASRSRRWGS